MLQRLWMLIRCSVEGYIADDAMSRGAAIAYYSFFSVAPLLVIAIAIAGVFFGAQAVEGAVSHHLQELMGPTGAQVVEGLIRSAADQQSSRIAAGIGIAVLLFSASSVFTEVQAALNVIWRAPAQERDTWIHLVRNKLLSIAFVLGTGVLLLASLVATAVMAAVTSWATELVPQTGNLVSEVNFAVSFVTTASIFAIVYKALPNRHIGWRDVGVGALVTALLFTIGKWLIGFYIGTTGIASTYGAAGALMAVLLWIYYSAQIFLLGAEFTKVWAGMQGNAEAQEALAAEPVNPSRQRRRERRERKKRGPSGWRCGADGGGADPAEAEEIAVPGAVLRSAMHAAPPQLSGVKADAASWRTCPAAIRVTLPPAPPAARRRRSVRACCGRRRGSSPGPRHPAAWRRRSPPMSRCGR